MKVPEPCKFEELFLLAHVRDQRNSTGETAPKCLLDWAINTKELPSRSCVLWNAAIPHFLVTVTDIQIFHDC